MQVFTIEENQYLTMDSSKGIKNSLFALPNVKKQTHSNGKKNHDWYIYDWLLIIQ